jgi:site-specific recombinase XerD
MSIIEYLKEFPREDSEFLFTTLVRGNKMGTGDIRKLVKTLGIRARINKRVYPHLLRHSLTANMLLRGADIISLKNQLRHNWLETTLHYANSIIFVEKNLYQKFAPSYI